MPILFGWGHQKIKEFGPVTRHNCEHCSNNSYWGLYSVSLYFTLFFIPVFSYSTKYFIACPICNNNVELTEEMFEYFNQFSMANAAYNESRITKEEYQFVLKELNSGHE